MNKRLIGLLIWLAAAMTLTAGTRIIPVAGHSSGANASSWVTDLSLTNNDARTNSVTLLFHADNGATVSRTVTLPAGSSLLLSDAVRPESFPGANPTNWIGQLEVHSSGNISASARTFTGAPNGGTYGSAYESFDPAVLSQDGAMSGLVHGRRFRSNIAYVNAGDALAVVSYTVRAENGTMLASNQLPVAAHTTVQISLSRDIAPFGDDARVMVEWSSTTPLYAIASVIDNRSNDPTNVPSVNSATELFFPVVGRTNGAAGTFWSTSAAVGNRSDIPGTVTFAYRDVTNGQLYTKTVTIPAHGTLTADDLNTFVGANAGSGSLTITSTVPVVSTVRVFNTQSDGSTYGSALLSQDNAVRSSSVSIKGVRRDDAYRLNVSLSSHSGATDGTVRLRDDNGQEVEVEPFHLEHGAMSQISLNRGSAQVRSGEVEVETHNGVSIVAVASSIDNNTGDTSMREAEQENERHHELEIRISPKVAAINAPIDFTIGSGTGVASVQWTFGDGTTGTGINTTHTYARSGEFSVTAEVTLTGGAIVRDQEDVHILSNGTTGGTNNGPIDFSWSPLAPAPGQLVTFTASRTTNGGSFKWKFPGNVRQSGGVASFTFANAGSFEVELELEHEGHATLHAEHVVTVGGTPNNGGNTSSIDFTFSPTAPAAGQTVTFNATGGNGGTFVFKFPGNIRKTGSVVTFTFATAGSYEVELEQEREGSVTLHAKKIINVGGGSTGGNNPLDFTWLPANPLPGQEVTFTATGGNGGVLRFEFPGNVRKSGSVVTFTFPTAGSYEVELEQEREGSVTLHARHDIIVGGGSTGGGTTPTSVDFTWSPSSPRAGQPVTFTASSNGTLPAGASFKWRLPDDSRPQGPSVTYVFPAAGTYRIRVEIEHGGVEVEREKNVVVAP